MYFIERREISFVLLPLLLLSAKSFVFEACRNIVCISYAIIMDIKEVFIFSCCSRFSLAARWVIRLKIKRRKNIFIKKRNSTIKSGFKKIFFVNFTDCCKDQADVIARYAKNSIEWYIKLSLQIREKKYFM